MADSKPRVGIVIIGRNEGQRLVRALDAVRDAGAPVVYVDSASTDGSPQRARDLGAEVVELDRSKSFTAARGRNAGVRRLTELYGPFDFFQFIDGDCALHPDWLAVAQRHMLADEKLGGICGRLREASRDGGNFYRRLLDMEWKGATGEISSCGGISMMRAAPFTQIGGFNEAVYAGEEAELCIRLREQGYRIVRLEAEMATHDSGINTFSPWWKRAVRSGHSFAEGARLHGGGPEKRHAKAVRSIFAWGLALPVAALVLAWPTRGISIALALLAYAALWMRVRSRKLRDVDHASDASLYATFCIVTKFAQVIGALTYYRKGFAGASNKNPAQTSIAPVKTEVAS